MPGFAVERAIKAPPAAIWAVITNAQRLAAGGFGITRIDGQIAAGKTIKLYSEVAPGRAFPLKVTGFAPGREMVWTGGMPLGLFTGTRRFTLSAAAGDVTRFSMREDYTGLLVGQMFKLLPDLDPSFQKFATALAAAVEARS